MVGCGSGNSTVVDTTNETVEQVEDTNNSEVQSEETNDSSEEANSTTEENNSSAEVQEIVIKEPEVEDISEVQKKIFFYRNGMKIFAKLHLPEGEGPFPLVIFAYGTNGSYVQTERIAQLYAKEGIAGLAFDFTGTEKGSQSEGTIAETSVLTQAADLEAILDSLQYLPYIDTKNVFFWGHSQGAFVATYAAANRPDMVRGLIAAEPGYPLRDVMSESYPNPEELPDVIYEPFAFGRKYMEDLVSFDLYDYIPNYKNPVIIIEGDTSPSMGADSKEYLDRAEEAFPSAKQVVIKGANHQFGGDTMKEVNQLAIQFIKENIGE